MRGRELIALKLPQMVEAQRREEEELMSPVSPASMGHSSNQLSQSSTISSMSLSSPTTPSGSVWSYPKVTSSNSSLPSSPMVRESLEGYGSSKRPLTDLKEETEDRDEDVEMVNGLQQQSPHENEVNCELNNYKRMGRQRRPFRFPKYILALRLTCTQIISEYPTQSGLLTTHKMIASSNTILQTRATSLQHPNDSVQKHRH